MKQSPGFTLAELLIALAILGVIATFTIPKVIQSQKAGKYNAVAKECVSMLSQAFQNHMSAGKLTTSTVPGDLSPYLNYVSIDTAGTLDGGITCNNAEKCYYLHNGAKVMLRNNWFGDSQPNKAISFFIDPDSKTDGTNELMLFIYYNGRVSTRGSIVPGTTDVTGANYDFGTDPAWLNWN
jgi:prepilin-type N-terminal cleavage/methylation domain-containing protein